MVNGCLIAGCDMQQGATHAKQRCVLAPCPPLFKIVYKVKNRPFKRSIL